MINVLQWIGLAFGVAVIAFGIMGFFRGLSLPPNPRSIARMARATPGGLDRADR